MWARSWELSLLTDGSADHVSSLTLNHLAWLCRDPMTVKKIKEAHRRIMIVNHPDRGGVSRSPPLPHHPRVSSLTPFCPTTFLTVAIPCIEDQRGKRHAGA